MLKDSVLSFSIWFFVLERKEVVARLRLKGRERAERVENKMRNKELNKSGSDVCELIVTLHSESAFQPLGHGFLHSDCVSHSF